MRCHVTERPAGIPGSTLTGPWPVGRYAAALREQLRGFTRVQVFGEVSSFKAGRARVWFELRDGTGALPCSMWRDDFDALGLGTLADGVQVVAAGGCDYYPGSQTASPAFSFAVTGLRIAGEGDLLAQLERLRRALHAEGLFGLQPALPRAALPKTIGVVCGEHSKARDDVMAGLRRRGWGGRVVWAFAPVQDRHAAPAITRALQDLAACAEVEVVIVARGGGSLADLFAFCDETLCRTVALLRVPVISSVGHHTDRTLLDDVAAVACSTPTHAAEAAVPVDCTTARRFARRQRRRGSSARAGGRSSSEPGPWRGCRVRRPRTSSATARGCTSTCASSAPPPAAGWRKASAARPRGRPCWRARSRPRSSPHSAAACERTATAQRWRGRRPPDWSAAAATSTASRSRSPRTIHSERSSAASPWWRMPPAGPSSPPRPRAPSPPWSSGSTTGACRCVRSRP